MAASSSEEGSFRRYGFDERIVRLFPRFLSGAEYSGRFKYTYSKSSCSACGETPADPSTLTSLDKQFQENYLEVIETLTRIILPNRAYTKHVAATSQILTCEKCAGKLRRLVILFMRMRKMEEEFSELRESVGSGLLEGSAEALGIPVADTEKAVKKWKERTRRNNRYFPHRIPLNVPNESVRDAPTPVSVGPRRRGRPASLPKPPAEVPVCVRCSVRLWTDPKPHSRISSSVTSESPQKKKRSTKSSTKDVLQPSVSFVKRERDPTQIKLKPRVVVKKISAVDN